MTRINLLPASELTDQHLIAEYRELPRIFTIVRTKIRANKKIVVGHGYTMGTGHVRFFYDKLYFLQTRLATIITECLQRGFKISFTQVPDISDLPVKYCQDYQPTERDIALSRQRIEEKLTLKPDRYTYYGKGLLDNAPDQSINQKK